MKNEPFYQTFVSFQSYNCLSICNLLDSQLGAFSVFNMQISEIP
nr:MAG TPA_asm: hypothetical protein [Caudoviricetes sp.]